MRAIHLATLTVLLATTVASGATALPSVSRTCGFGDDGMTNATVQCRGIDSGAAPGTSGRAAASKPRQCTWEGRDIACTSQWGTWSSQRGCYVAVVDPQPPKTSPVWEGNTDGVILKCVQHTIWQPNDLLGDDFWSPNNPAEGPNERSLAEQSIADLPIVTAELGSTPPSTAYEPDSLGVIGYPIWLWIANPGESTTGPVTRTATEAGTTVTDTATLESVTYSLQSRETGEVRASVTCEGANAVGTPYQGETGRYVPPDSPTCGIPSAENVKIGYYQINAEAHWHVDWAGPTQHGTDTLERRRSYPISVGEIQVLNTVPRTPTRH